MSSITFADVVHHAITFSRADAAEGLVIKLIDTPWVQRLRDISQTANTRLVYMFSEHSRFGHCLGVSYLALTLLRRLEQHHGEQIRPYRSAVAAAALLHDIGHIAPGSRGGSNPPCEDECSSDGRSALTFKANTELSRSPKF